MTDALELHRYRHEHEGSVDPSDELKGLVTALYFPDLSRKSRLFTRQLRQFYERVNNNNLPWGGGAAQRLEVIFVPPAEEEDAHGMEDHADWLYVIHRRREWEKTCGGDYRCAVCKLQCRYKLHDAPYMVLIRPNGDVLYTSAVADVRDCFARKWFSCSGGGPPIRKHINAKRAERTVDFWCWMLGTPATPSIGEVMP